MIRGVGDESNRAPNPNRARDHLANERTYLAWQRTALAVMALGLAIAGFARSASASSIVSGAILVAVGAAGLFYGTVRYRQVAREIEADVFLTRIHGPTVASAVLAVALVVALVVLLLGQR